jgi:hypothetical protein
MDPRMTKTRLSKIEWPSEAIEELRRLHRADHKAAAILARLQQAFPSFTFTRNSVMGKIWRLGLTNSNSPKRLPRSAAARRDKAPPMRWTDVLDALIIRDYGLGRQPGRIAEILQQEHQVITTRHAVRQRLIALGRYKQPGDVPPSGRGPLSREATPPKHLVIVEDLPETSVGIETTQARVQCQYPTSDDMKTVCGARATTGSYCERHAAVVYRSPPTGRRVASFHRRNEYYE